MDPLQLAIDDTGRGAPVLLLHSSGFSGRQWRRLADTVVARGYRAVVPDLTGHGRSPPWPAPTAFSFLDDVAAMVALARDLGPIHVVGHSYGALVALHLARRVEVRSLVLFDPVAFGVLDPVADADALAVLAALDLSPGDPERWLATFVDFWGGEGTWASLRESVRLEFRRVAWVVQEGVRTLMLDATPRSAYSALEGVVIMTGEHSPLPARRTDQRLVEAMPRARLEIVAGAGHLAPLTAPELVNRLVLDALTPV